MATDRVTGTEQASTEIPTPPRVWRWTAWAVPVLALATIPFFWIANKLSERRGRAIDAVCQWLPVSDRQVLCTYGAAACSTAAAVLWLALWVFAQRHGFPMLGTRTGRFARAVFCVNLLPLLVNAALIFCLHEEQISVWHFRDDPPWVRTGCT